MPPKKHESCRTIFTGYIYKIIDYGIVEIIPWATVEGYGPSSLASCISWPVSYHCGFVGCADASLVLSSARPLPCRYAPSTFENFSFSYFWFSAQTF